jgi:hypothetical protein
MHTFSGPFIQPATDDGEWRPADTCRDHNRFLP